MDLNRPLKLRVDISESGERLFLVSVITRLLFGLSTNEFFSLIDFSFYYASRYYLVLATNPPLVLLCLSPAPEYVLVSDALFLWLIEEFALKILFEFGRWAELWLATEPFSLLNVPVALAIYPKLLSTELTREPV